MYPLACLFLFSLGMAFNYLSGDKRMLALCLAVGVSTNMYYLTPQDSAASYYTFCIAVDVVVCLIAWILRASGSSLISFLCVLLVISHTMGWILDGSQPLSPYRLIVKILEFSQLMACVALSPLLLPILRNHDVSTQ